MKRAAGAAFLLILVGLMAMAIAGDKAPTAAPATKPASEPMVTRFYDVRDLITDVPDFAAPELVLPANAIQGGGGNTSLFGSPREISGPTRQEIIEQIMTSIDAAIDPDSWKAVGGGAGVIRNDRGVLIVTQTAANQKRLDEFLSQYRKAFLPVPIRIRAHWILTRRGDLAASLRPVEAHLAAPHAAGDAKSAASALLQADEASLDKIPGAVHFRGEIVCMSGQHISLTTTNTRSTTAATEVGGLVLNVGNILSPDRANVLLLISSQWSDPLPGTAQLPTTRPADTAEVNRALHDLRTAVRVPWGKSILVGGMTLDPTPAADRANPQQVGDEPVQMYLFIEATMQPN
ncbi:MAG TPA: hypothetical protein VFE47_00750 [Tepidisphaeraceae bacterium]|nr:hypothetical protein [Tepidisphaeraceae bacterium]